MNPLYLFTFGSSEGPVSPPATALPFDYQAYKGKNVKMPTFDEDGSIPSLIRTFLSESPEISSGDVARTASVTRQAAHYHLRRMVEAGELKAIGAGRGRRYALAAAWRKQFETAGLLEDAVWREVLLEVPSVGGMPRRAQDIARFAFTEMLNNAIEHSGADIVSISVLPGDAQGFVVSDEGIGAFENVRRAKRLEDHLAAIQEIAKGKLTTDPSRHTGQGIFFTSKAVDLFTLTTNGWRWTVDNVRHDEAIARVGARRGTHVSFSVDPHTRRSLNEVFDDYTDPDTLDFDTTRTVVRLFEYGVSFVSRSEAKRLTRNLDQFKEVFVDFRGVEWVGQGFADEVFRVWQSDHPDVRLTPVNMNEAVRRFVERARPPYQDAKGISPR